MAAINNRHDADNWTGYEAGWIEGKTWQQPGRRHYTPAGISERSELVRFGVYIVGLLVLVGLAGGIAS